jgi:hypothetical protein
MATSSAAYELTQKPALLSFRKSCDDGRRDAAKDVPQKSFDEDSVNADQNVTLPARAAAW